MRYLVIRSGDSGKGRSFRAEILVCVEAMCWDGAITSHRDDTIRPVYLVLATSDGAAVPVTANLRLGRTADVFTLGDKDKAKPLELLKSAGYEIHHQRHPQGTVIEAYLPKLFLPTGQVEEVVQFIVLPPRDELAGQIGDMEGVLAHLRRAGMFSPPREHFSRGWGDQRPTEVEALAVLPYAPLFASMLATRTKCPLVGDERYMAQVLLTFLSRGEAMRASDGYRDAWGCAPSNYGRAKYREEGVEEAGLAPGIMVSSLSATVAQILAQETAAYFAALR